MPKAETDPIRNDPASENHRFLHTPIMADLELGDCARKYASALDHHEYDDGNQLTEYHSRVVYGSDGKPINAEQNQEESA